MAGKPSYIAFETGRLKFVTGLLHLYNFECLVIKSRYLTRRNGQELFRKRPLGTGFGRRRILGKREREREVDRAAVCKHFVCTG